MSDEMKITERDDNFGGLPTPTHKPIMLNDIWKIEVTGRSCDSFYIEITNKDGKVIFSHSAEELVFERGNIFSEIEIKGITCEQTNQSD